MKPSRPPEPKVARTIEIAKEFKVTDPMLSEQKLLEAKNMASIYPLLYVLENSIRELIDRVMSAKHGPDWWDTHAPQDIKRKVADHMSDEKRNSWHQKRGSRPIDYTDLKDLKPIVRKAALEIVPGFIPSIEWFDSFIDEVYRSRCVLCHMNPLDDNNITAVKVKFRQWQKQVAEKIALMPGQA
jgi:predicted restriction endonuclease